MFLFQIHFSTRTSGSKSVIIMPNGLEFEKKNKQECRIKVTCTVTAYNMRSIKIVFSTVEKRIINCKSTIAYQAQFHIGNIQPSFISAIYNLYSDFARDSYLL